jgi:MFS family permease
MMTAPGQTAAISVFTEPLIHELGISRTTLSTAYLIGTLTGAAAMPLVGRALDRHAIARVMAVIAAVFGAVLMSLSLVTEVIGLTAGFVGIRMAGQGALGLAATTAVALHVTRGRGLALGVTSAVGAAGISLAPIGLERLLAAHGMDAVWRYEALAVWAIVLPVALIGLRGARPVVAHPDTTPRTQPSDTTPAVHTPPSQWRPRAALSTAMFWVVAAALAASGMLTTGLNFHQIAVLGEQGLTATQAAANFLPQTVAGLAGTIGVGALADRIDPRFGMFGSMLLLAGALLILPLTGPGWTVITYGMLLGAAGGSIRTIEAVAYANYFGTRHLGSIRGLATTISVASTAFGPLLLSTGQQVTGHFWHVAAGCAAIPLVVAIGALLVPRPVHPDVATVTQM